MRHQTATVGEKRCPQSVSVSLYENLYRQINGITQSQIAENTGLNNPPSPKNLRLMLTNGPPHASTKTGWRSSRVAQTHSKGKKMKNLKNLMLRLWKEEEGQDLVEYGLLVALLSLAAVATMKTLATAINGIFVNVGTTLTNAT